MTTNALPPFYGSQCIGALVSDLVERKCRPRVAMNKIALN